MIYILGYDDNADGEAYLTKLTTSDNADEILCDCSEMLKAHDHVLITFDNLIKENNLHMQKFTAIQPYSIEVIIGKKLLELQENGTKC